MKNRLIIIGVLIFIFTLALLMFNQNKAQLQNQNKAVEFNETPIDSTSNKMEQNNLQIAGSAVIQKSMMTNSRADRELDRKARMEQIQAEWKTPINFYGLIVDESNNPVVDANIGFDCNDLSESGTSFYNKKSDENGKFYLTDVLGRGISVHVSKDGYYTSRHNVNNFEYAGQNENFVPDANNPVVFHLHKKGQGVQLTTSAYGVAMDFPVLAPLDGNSVKVDLLQRKVEAAGDLEISQIKPDSAHLQQATNWSFHMNLSDGGFIEENDAFPFTAPDGGYQSTIDLEFNEGSTNWATQFTKTYYIVFGEPQKYGWLQVDANIGQQTVFLKYAINPTGSRNLEPQ